MRKILIIGAGKSSSYLIKYLLDKSQSENLHITIGDLNIANAKKLIGDHIDTDVIHLDVFNTDSRAAAIQNADIVVLLVAHDEFKSLSFDSNKVILDFCGISK